MKVGQFCNRSVVTIHGSADASEAAKLMRDEHIGFLVVHKDGDALRKPIGVLTDRDLVLTVMAKDVNPHSLTVQDIMTRQPVIANDSDEFRDLLPAMRTAGIRRVPVIDVRGALVGVIAIDDAVDFITNLMCEISGTIKGEQRLERRLRSG